MMTDTRIVCPICDQSHLKYSAPASIEYSKQTAYWYCYCCHNALMVEDLLNHLAGNGILIEQKTGRKVYLSKKYLLFTQESF